MDSFAGKLAVVTGGGSGWAVSSSSSSRRGDARSRRATGTRMRSDRPRPWRGRAPRQARDAQLAGLIPPGAQAGLISARALPEGASADDLRHMLAQANTEFRDKAPLSAAQAVAIILDGVRSGAWRILVGEDAKMIDASVRATPEAAYDYAELFSGLAEEPAAETPER